MNPDVKAIQSDLKSGGLWLVALGILQVVIGFFAIYAPDLAGVATTIALGVILLFGSVFEFVISFEMPNWKWGTLRFLSGILAVAIGLLFLFKPTLGLESLTLFLVVWFIIEGIDRIVTGIWLKGIPGRGWMILGGVASIVLGVLLIMDWPLSSQWAVGVLIGVNLIFAGWSKIFLGVSARSVGKEIGEAG